MDCHNSPTAGDIQAANMRPATDTKDVPPAAMDAPVDEAKPSLAYKNPKPGSTGSDLDLLENEHLDYDLEYDVEEASDSGVSVSVEIPADGKTMSTKRTHSAPHTQLLTVFGMVADVEKYRKFEEYDVEVVPEEGDKSSEIKLCSFRRPHMRAFHLGA